MYPAFTWHLKYEETRPELGESPLNFLKMLEALFEESDIMEVDEKDRLVYKFLSWYLDKFHIMELQTVAFTDLWQFVEVQEKQLLPDTSLTKVAWHKLALHSPTPIAMVQVA